MSKNSFPDKENEIVITSDLNIGQSEKIWNENEAQSYFLTWQWIGTWLRVFSNDQKVKLVYLLGKKKILGCCFFAIETKIRFQFLKQNILTLNTCTTHDGSLTCIEYNNFMISNNDFGGYFINKLFHNLGQEKELKWDILYIPYMPAKDFTTLKSQVAKTYNLRILNIRTDVSYFTELGFLNNDSDYFKYISKSNRINIQQNLARYKKYGTFKIKVATNTQEALHFFEELKNLNILRFKALKATSVFENSKYLEFHNCLIKDYFLSKEISLIKLIVGEIIVGIVYSFIHKNNVFFYQSGFDFSLESRLSPGIFSLYNLMKYYADLGYEKFYFLAGNADYKRGLATGKDELVSFEIHNNSPKNRLIEMLSRLKPKILHER